MQSPRPFLLTLVAFAVLSFSGPLYLPNALAATIGSSQPPDNSSQNRNQAATADRQTNAKADRMTLAQVRKAIVADKGLSTYAHNIKILVFNGTVTLEGPVNSEDERRKVAADVASVVSADKVANQLTVKK